MMREHLIELSKCFKGNHTDTSKDATNPAADINKLCKETSTAFKHERRVIARDFQDLMIDVAGSLRNESDVHQNLHIINSLSVQLNLDVFEVTE